MNSESFIERTKQKYKELYWDTTKSTFPRFKDFFIDHKELLLKNATKITLTEQEMYFKRFELTSLLMDHGYDPSCVWIVMMMNNLDSELDFVNLSYINVPDKTTLFNLYRSYISYITKYAKN